MIDIYISFMLLYNFIYMETLLGEIGQTLHNILIIIVKIIIIYYCCILIFIDVDVLVALIF